LVPEDVLVDVHELLDELVHDSNNDILDLTPILAVLPSHTASQRHIPLASLFSYVEQVGADCLKFYWKGGLRNIEQEVAAYNLMQGDENTGSLGGAECHSNTTESGTLYSSNTGVAS